MQKYGVYMPSGYAHLLRLQAAQMSALARDLTGNPEIDGPRAAEILPVVRDFLRSVEFLPDALGVVP